MKRLLLIALMSLLATCSTSPDPVSLPDVSDANDTIQDGSQAELEITPAICGDGICAPEKENCETCVEDCGECSCGDGECTADESCDSCAEDCGECQPECGDDKCGDDEDCASCPGDCGNCCPNEECGDDEDCTSCPADCGECPVPCGDGECKDDEACDLCPEDCGECECGDGSCNGEEDCDLCPEDCGECGCGDGNCGGDEDCGNCAEDCGECECGDGTCNGDEDCDTCPDDCTNCDPYCGDAVVDESLEEECDDGNTAPDDGCDEECKIEPQAAEPGTIVITEIMKNPEMVDDVVGEWFELYNSGDVDVDLNGWKLADEGIDEHKIFSYDGVVIASKGYLVFGKEADKELNGGLDVDYVYSNFNLSNKDDEIVLSVYGVTIDEVGYDNGQNFPGAPGKSLSLSPESYDGTANDDGAAWCDGTTAYGDGDLGSPGEANPDCDGLCGNDACDDGEDCLNCFDDCGPCPPVCPDGDCNGDETCTTCPDDCGTCPPACPDGDCNGDETCTTCPDDCGTCPPACPDGDCNGNETCTTCPADCGTCPPACPDGDCNGNETCTTCPADCGACPEESWCKLSGDQNDKVECEIRIAAESNSSSKATQFQFDIDFDSSKLAFDGTKCLVNGLDMCGQFGIIGAGHSVDTQPQQAGVVRLTLTKSGTPKSISDAYLSGQSVLGNPYVLNLVFSLKTNVPANQASQVTLTGMKGADATASPLSASQQDDGLIVTSASDEPYCGDGECNNGEQCADCSEDCGACPSGGWCELSGSQGEQLACQIDLAASSNSSPKATQFQFDINFSASKINFVGTKCLVNGLDMCGQFGIIGAGHSVDTQPQQAGVVRLTLTKSGTPKSISDAYVSGQSVQGDPYVLDLLFSLKTSVAANQAEAVTLSEIKGADASASPLSATQNSDGVIVTSAQ